MLIGAERDNREAVCAPLQLARRVELLPVNSVQHLVGILFGPEHEYFVGGQAVSRRGRYAHVDGIAGACHAILRESRAAIASDVLRKALQSWNARVPRKDCAAVSVIDEVRKIAELQRTHIEDIYVAASPQQAAGRRNLIRPQLAVAAKSIVAHPRDDHRSIVGGVQVAAPERLCNAVFTAR